MRLCSLPLEWVYVLPRPRQSRGLLYVLLGTASDWEDIRRIGRGWLEKDKECARPESIANLKCTNL